jgi:RimJ/RimL family protein N-acetyltransferase
MPTPIPELGPEISDAVKAALKKAVLPPKWPAGGRSGYGIRLLPLDTEADAEELFAGSTGAPYKGRPAYDAEKLIWRYIPYGPFKSKEDMYIQYLKPLASRQVEHTLGLVVHMEETGEKVGIICLMNNNPTSLVIELGGIWYMPCVQGKGINTAAVKLCCEYYFEEQGYLRVEWKCNAQNLRSRAAALRLGFEYNGLFPKHWIVRNRHRDTAWYATTEDGWPKMKATLENSLRNVGKKTNLSKL